MVTIRNFATLLVSTLAALSIAGCGGSAAGNGGGGGGGGDPQNPQLAKSDAQRVASGTQAGAQAFKPPRSGFAPGCPTLTNAGTDTDGDGVTSYTAMQYTDCSMDAGWGPSIVNGNEVLVDQNQSANDFDITHAVDFQIAVQDTAGTAVHLQEANNGAQSGGGWELDEATVTDISSADANGSYTEHDEVAYAKVYHPVSAWMPGQALVAGGYDVSGAYKITVTNGSGSTEVDFAVSTLTELQLDPACPTLIVSGSIEAVFADANGTHDEEITWTACDASNVQLVPMP